MFAYRRMPFGLCNAPGTFQRRSKQRIENFNLAELSPLIITMADQRTMAHLLQAPTEGDEDAIVVPAITADNFELKHGLLTLVQNKHEAWDRFKDLIRACPHHGFSELHQLDTFYNALNSKDQDSLNSAASGDFLDKMPHECLDILESKSKVCYSRNKLVIAKVSTNTSTFGISLDVAELKDIVKALLLDKKNQNQSPAPMKADEESCVTYGGAHSYSSAPQTQDVSKKDFSAYVKANDAFMRNIQTQGHNMQNQLIDLITKFVKSNSASTSSLGTLPSNTIANTRSDLKAITTRSEVTKDTVNPTNNGSTDDVQPQVVQSESLILTSEPITSLIYPGKFLIPCDFPELADRLISRPVGVAEDVYVKVGSFHFPDDFVVVDFDADPRAPLILGRLFLKTGRALIDVFKGELTLRVGKEAITFNLDQTSRYSANYSDMTAKHIDPYLDPEGDILLLESFLNDDLSLPPLNQRNYLPEVHKELKICKAKSHKSSVDEPPAIELKDLPPHLEYAFLEGDEKLPIIIAKDLSMEEKTALITVLKSHKLCNAPSTFQKCMMAIFHDMIEKTIEVFMDDFFVFGNSFQSCLSHLERMQKRCKDTNLCLNWEKNHFMVKEGIVLSHKISKQRIKVDKAKEFTFKVIDTKGTENLAACHLSRLENPHQNVLDLKKINESFPLETLNLVSTRVGENHASWSNKLDDALWVFHTAYKTPIESNLYKLVYGKACHLPVELEHKAYWALIHANFDLKTAGDHRKVQINELNELRDQAYENSLVYKEKTKRLHDSKIKNRVFNIGDRVFLFNFRLKIFSGKLK
nr:reverse transcriptase domain-containing protein [Tanacetum cinerariifolium]